MTFDEYMQDKAPPENMKSAWQYTKEEIDAMMFGKGLEVRKIEYIPILSHILREKIKWLKLYETNH